MIPREAPSTTVEVGERGLASVTVEIPGVPFANPRVRFDPRSGKRAYPPKSAVTWRKLAQDYMREALEGCDLPAYPEGPLSLEVFARWPMPRSRWLKRFPRPAEWRAQRPDTKNVLEAVEDAAKGILWLDDRQVALHRLVKITGEQGQAGLTVVRVGRIESEPWEFEP